MSYWSQAYMDLGCDRLPHPVAEHLSPEVAYASMMKFTTKKGPEGKLHSAWRHAEFALNRGTLLDDDIRRSYVDTAQALLSDVICQPATRESTRFEALVLSTYLPLLQKRALQQEVEAHDCDYVYQSLGRAVEYMQPLPPDEPPPSIMNETALMALSARTRRPDFLLYPASPREEASNLASFNHDSYFLRFSEKLPIQQKLPETTYGYDSSVTIVSLDPILMRGYKKFNIEPPRLMSEKVNDLLALIVVDTHTTLDLTKQEKALLNHLSASVARTYFDAVATQKAAA